MKHFMLIAILGFTLSNVEARGDKKHREAFKECAEKVGLVKGEKPSPENKAKLGECLKAKGIEKPKRKKSKEHKEAFKTCRQELGIEKREKGKKLDDDTRAKLKECLEAKGVKRPQRRG